MARLKTAQPNSSLRKIAVVVATAVSGMSVYAQAAVQPKEETITVTAAPAAQESAWGPAPTIAAKRSATTTKTDTPIEKTPQSVSVVTNEEMQMHQFQSVKEALGYTPGVTVSSRGASNTYDFVIIRGFSSVGLSQNNYLDGLKLQGNFYNDAVIDPYMLERVELMRGPTSVLYGKSNPGGIISMVSKRPTTEPLKEIQFKMGTDNLFQTGFDFSDSLDDNGEFSYRLTGLARSTNEQQKSSESQRYAIAPSLPGVLMRKRILRSFLISRTNQRPATTAGCRKRERLNRYRMVNACRQISMKGRQTTPILVTRKWWDTVSSMASTTLLPCARIYVLSK